MNIVCTAPNLANFLYNITHIELLATTAFYQTKGLWKFIATTAPHSYITCDFQNQRT